MSDGNAASILSVYSDRRADREAIDRADGAMSAKPVPSSDLRPDLDRAFELVGEIRGIFEARQTYVLHTLLDLVAIEIRLLQKERGGQYSHSSRDITEAYSTSET